MKTVLKKVSWMKVILFIMSIVIVYLLSKVFNQAREIGDLKYDNKLYKGKLTKKSKKQINIIFVR